MNNSTPAENLQSTGTPNTSGEPMSDEQLLENLDRSLPALWVSVAAAKMRQSSPESLKAVPEELRGRFQKGDPTVLGDLLKEKPELFRRPELNHLEDAAFEQVLK